VADERRERDRISLEGQVALEVATGAEGTPRTGHEHTPNGWVGFDRVEHAVELSDHRPVDGIELLGPVEADDRGPPGESIVDDHMIDEQARVVVGHARSSDVNCRTSSCFCTFPDAVV